MRHKRTDKGQLVNEEVRAAIKSTRSGKIVNLDDTYGGMR